MKIMPQKTLQVYLRLLHYVRRYWCAFALGILGTMMTAGTDATFTWFLKPILDKGFVAHEHHFIHWLPQIIVIGFLVRGCSFFMSNYYITRVARSVVNDFRQAIFAHLMRLPAPYFDNHSSGELLSTLIYNVEQLAKASTDVLLTLVQESSFILGLLVVMLTISWKLCLMFIVFVPLIALTTRSASRRMRMLSKHIQSSMGEITNVAEEAIEGYRVVRMFNATHYEIDKFNKATLRSRFRELKMVVTNALATSTVLLVAGSLIAVIIYLTTRKHLHLTAGGFTSMMAAMLAILKPMKNITTINATLQRGVAAAESIFALLDEPLEKDTGAVHFERARGKIEFQHVHFEYQSNDKRVLQDIHFVVHPGERIAIVGRSGGGKSTLINLLPRFYEPTSGKILLDDIDIHTISMDDLRKQFAWVSQHVTLFNDTIANNIAYGRTHVSEVEILMAAKAAHALEFISHFPQGLQTLVGENGVMLSGGQRQRIAIARALLKDAPILLLDEATSSLDTESEKHIQAALNAVMQGRTTLIIAHRLSTIENADKIIVLEKGRIIEVGTHASLLAQQGHYARLHDVQFEETV